MLLFRYLFSTPAVAFFFFLFVLSRFLKPPFAPPIPAFATSAYLAKNASRSFVATIVLNFTLFSFCCFLLIAVSVTSPSLDVDFSFFGFPFVALTNSGQSFGGLVEDGCASRSGKGSVASFVEVVVSDVWSSGFCERNIEPLDFEVVLVMRSERRERN